MTILRSQTPHAEVDDTKEHLQDLINLIAGADAFLLVTVQPEDEFGNCEITEDGGGGSRLNRNGLLTMAVSATNLLEWLATAAAPNEKPYPWEKK